MYDWISSQSSNATADRYIQRIEAAYRAVAHLPERGTRHDNLMPGLRIIGMERRVTIAFRVEGRTVAILRILYAGRDVQTAIDEET